MWEKLKHVLTDDRWFQLFVLSLLLIAAFLLGRVSVQTESSLSGISQVSRISLQASPETVLSYTVPAASATDVTVSGSINGSRYYGNGCAAGDRIAAENKLYFRSVDAAKAAGYTQSKLCVFP